VQDTARVVQERTAHLYDAGVRRLAPNKNSKAGQDPAEKATRDEIGAS
jgi:hypothetical protein